MGISRRGYKLGPNDRPNVCHKDCEPALTISHFSTLATTVRVGRLSTLPSSRLILQLPVSRPRITRQMGGILQYDHSLGAIWYSIKRRLA